MAIELSIRVGNGGISIAVGDGQARATGQGGKGPIDGPGPGSGGPVSASGDGCGCGTTVIGPIVVDGSAMQAGFGQSGQGGKGPIDGPGPGGSGPIDGPGPGGSGPIDGPGPGGAGPGGGRGSCGGTTVIGPIVITGCCLGSRSASNSGTSDCNIGSQEVALDPPQDQFGSSAATAPANSLLPFAMEPQQQNNWCWAAVAVSVNNFLDPRTPPTWSQGRLAADLLKNPSCSLTPPATACNVPEDLQGALGITGNLRRNGYMTETHLAFDSICNWVNSHLPVGARIKWRGPGAHFIALDGYRVTSSGRRMVHVQDPDATTSPGFIDYEELVENYRNDGSWVDTYLVIA